MAGSFGRLSPDPAWAGARPAQHRGSEAKFLALYRKYCSLASLVPLPGSAKHSKRKRPPAFKPQKSNARHPNKHWDGGRSASFAFGVTAASPESTARLRWQSVEKVILDFFDHGWPKQSSSQPREFLGSLFGVFLGHGPVRSAPLEPSALIGDLEPVPSTPRSPFFNGLPSMRRGRGG